MGSGRPERQVVVAVGWVRRGDAVLWVRRHDPTLVGAHGKWELPGGKVAFGERPEATVARELLEETGWEVAVERLLPYSYSTVWEYPDRRQHAILLLFDCRPVRHHPGVADASVGEIAWRPPEAIDPAEALPSVAHFLAWWRREGSAGRHGGG